MRKFLLLLGSTCLALLAAELLVREVLERRWERAAAAFRASMYAVHPDRELAFALRPGAGSSRVLTPPHVEWSYSINSAGMRGDEVALDKGERRRICVLGDSYTFGWGVGQAETYPVALQALLEAEGAPVEVLNFGVPGYNTSQSLLDLQSRVARYAPDLVVLGFVVNDAEPQRTVPAHPAVTFGECRSWAIELAKPSLARLLGGPDVLRSHRFEYDETPPALQFQPGSPAWRACRAALHEMVAHCRAEGIDFVCYLLPDFNRRFTYDYGDLWVHEVAREALSEVDGACDDLLPAFLGRDHARLFVPGDQHPGPAGMRLLAAEMARSIRYRFPHLLSS